MIHTQKGSATSTRTTAEQILPTFFNPYTLWDRIRNYHVELEVYELLVLSAWAGYFLFSIYLIEIVILTLFIWELIAAPRVISIANLNYFPNKEVPLNPMSRE